ncbi:MAG: TonB-dependent receptor [Bacteroidales bacterium]|nr:TonB-dependent receptor [Bacteroidales bacterium]
MKRLIVSLLMLCISVVAFGQQTEASGTVVEKATNEPIPGVTVLEKGTNNGTVTDINGKFTLKVSSDATLVFSFVGMKKQEVPVAGNTTFNIALEQTQVGLEEFVVTGYQVQRKADLTGAVSVVKVEDAKQESNPNIISSIQGRVSGLQVTSSGEPGGGATSLNIRGFSTINDNAPLYVIDGVPTKTGINKINPNDIESIQVLKDAASASIYGSRASNGVIVITTKKGKDGDMDVSFNSYVGVQGLRNRLDVLNAKEWGEVYWQAKRNAGETPSHPQYGSWKEPIMPSYIDANNEIPAGNTDWIDEAFDPAMMQYYNLGISNSSDKGNVYFSTSYTDQEGIMRYTGFNRITARLNSSYNLLDRLEVGENISVSYTNRTLIDDPGFTHQILFQHPLIPVYTENGDWAGPTDGLGDKRNPIAVLSQNKENYTKEYRLFGNAYADLEIIEGLNIKSNIGIDYIPVYDKQFDPRWQEGTRSVDQNYLTMDYKYDLSWNWTNTANYVYTSDNHNINAVLGIEAIHSEGQGIYGRVSDFLVQGVDFRYLDAGTGEQTNGGWGVESSLLSYFGKIDYTLMGKYLVSATLRRDGSSRLGENERIDYFPAFSLGWRVNEESFMDSYDFISNLKIRGGYGKTGNQAIPTNAAYTIYQPDVEYAQYNLNGDNSTPSAGYRLVSHGNPSLLWETATQTNIGLDLGLWDDKLMFTADYFIKETDGMLVNPPLLGVWGEGAAPYINGGKMENKGIEMSLDYRGVVSEDFTYEAGLNFSKTENEVLDIGEGNDFFDFAPGRIEPGHPVFAFYGYVADGLFRSIDDIENHATQEGIDATERSLGRIRYQDLNDDGVINEQDRQYIGSPHPDFSMGLNLSASYKNFDISMFIEGVFGRDIYNTHKRMTDFTYWNFNYGARTLDAWTPENPDSDIPAVSTSNFNNEYRHSTYFIEDGTYVKFKNIVIGYTLPSSFTDKANLESVRFYVQAQNIFNITDYTGMDYEVGAASATFYGVDNQFYPHTKNVNLGVNINF